jgi:hypothetical protein
VAEDELLVSTVRTFYSKELAPRFRYNFIPLTHSFFSILGNDQFLETKPLLMPHTSTILTPEPQSLFLGYFSKLSLTRKLLSAIPLLFSKFVGSLTLS